jgi:hypothetical protein
MTNPVRAALSLTLLLLTLAPGMVLAHEGGHQAKPSGTDYAFFADEIAAFIGQPLPAEYKAEMADISSTFSFKQPTTVFAGELGLKLEEDTASADVIVFLRGGKIAGVELIYVPVDSTEFGALPFDEQQARFDLMYSHIINNFSGSDLGEIVIDDDTGALYEWQDGRGTWWSLDWAAEAALSLSFDAQGFKNEHELNRNQRTGSDLAGHDHDDHAGHAH